MTDHILEFTGERLIPEKSSSNTFWEHVYRYYFALDFITNKKVLDIASGEGYGTAALYAAGAKEVIGIDISIEACQYSQHKYHLDFRVGDAHSIPLESNSIDTIVSFETIEHLSNAELFLQECARVLKPGGSLILSTPNINASQVNKDNVFHVKLFELSEIVNLLNKNFSHLQIYSQCPEHVSMFTLRSLAALRSPLRKYNIYKKVVNVLRNFCCGEVFDQERASYYKSQPIKAILKKKNVFEKFINPYFVTKYNSLVQEIPMFYIFVVRSNKRAP